MLKRLFGRKPASAFVAKREVAESRLDSIRLTMDEIARYCVAAARWRGFPEDSHTMIARRVVFLERRGLPGFGALIREMTLFSSETLQQRASLTRPNGQSHSRCPIMTAAIISDDLDQFTSLAPDQVSVIPAPSNPVLLLPKLADYAGPSGKLVMATFYVDRQPVARAVVDGHRLAYMGDANAFMEADHLGISCFPEEGDVPATLSAGYLDEIEMPLQPLTQLMHLMETVQ